MTRLEGGRNENGRHVLYFGWAEVTLVNAYDNLTAFAVNAYFSCVFTFPTINSEVTVK